MEQFQTNFESNAKAYWPAVMFKLILFEEKGFLALLKRSTLK